MGSRKGTCVLMLLLLWTASAVADSKIIKLPAPTGSDDTAVIQDAITACQGSSGGCHIIFQAGVYKTKQLLGTDFHGKLTGQGMGTTILDALPNLHVEEYSFVDQNANIIVPTLAAPFPVLVTFLDSDVQVSNLTLRVTAAAPISPWWYGWSDVTFMEALLSIVGSTQMDVAVDHVSFEGLPPGSPMNLNNGLEFYGIFPGWAGGTLKVTSCRFVVPDTGIQLTWARNANVVIGGSQADGNYFKVGTNASLLMLENENVAADFSYNKNYADFGGEGVWVAQQLGINSATVPVTAHVHHNTFRLTGPWAEGVLLLDGGPISGLGTLIEGIVNDNSFEIHGTADGDAWAAIEAQYPGGAQIRGNRITGDKTFFGITADDVMTCLVDRNDFTGFTPSVADIGVLTFDPYPPATNCTIVVTGKMPSILDQGVGTVVVGPSMKARNRLPKDALRLKLQFLKKHMQ